MKDLATTLYKIAMVRLGNNPVEVVDILEELGAPGFIAVNVLKMADNYKVAFLSMHCYKHKPGEYFFTINYQKQKLYNFY